MKANEKCCELLERERQKLDKMMAEGGADRAILKQSRKLDKLILAFMKANIERETQHDFFRELKKYK